MPTTVGVLPLDGTLAHCGPPPLVRQQLHPARRTGGTNYVGQIVAQDETVTAIQAGLIATASSSFSGTTLTVQAELYVSTDGGHLHTPDFDDHPPWGPLLVGSVLLRATALVDQRTV